MTIPSTFLLLLLSTTLSIADNSDPATFLALFDGYEGRNSVAFHINYAMALQLLRANITVSGFGMASCGNTDPAYVLGQCFNYLSSLDCELCYAQMLVKLPTGLSTSESSIRFGRVYLDGCFLRYANYSFFDSPVDGFDTTQCSNVSASEANSIRFTESVVQLVTDLTLEAEMDSEHYSVMSTVAARKVTLYGMAQCWRSLNVSGCRECLQSARQSVVRCSPGLEGKVLNAGCFLRYSTLPFYLGSTTTRGFKGTFAVRHRLGPILGSVFGILVLATATSLLWMRRKATNETRDGLGLECSEEVMRTITTSNLNFKYEYLRNATDNFSEKNKLGQGGYGSVYKGVLSDGREVAVKRMFINTKSITDQFFNEIILINQVQHKNLVKLLGCSIEGPESLLVYEYLPNTSLEKFLFDTLKNNVLDWGKRFDIIVGTADGLSYLHNSSEIRIIHRDIKASNILLDERFKPKIADFGLARNFGEDKSHLNTGLAGTYGYMAPEYIVHGQLTEKADVYSYGILVIEILTGLKNQCLVAASTGCQSLMSMVWQHFNSGTLIELLDRHLLGQCSTEEAVQVFHVGILCTQTSPTLRPPMWKVVEMLTGRSRVMLPTQPPFSSTSTADINNKHSETSRLLSASPKPQVSENQMPISSMQGR